MFVAVVIAIAVIGGTSMKTASAEGAVFAGGCVLTLTLTYSSPVGRLPGPVTMGLGAGGPCVVNGVLTTIAMSGTVSTTALAGWGCGSGVATGTAAVSVPLPGFPGPLLQVAVVNSGGMLTLAAHTLLVTFEGVGELAPAAGTAAACATGVAASSGTWTGPFVFQDPTLPPPL